MVEEPSDYVWSSYRCNAFGIKSKLNTPHDTYLELGSTEKERFANYRELFRYQLDGTVVNEIRNSVNKGLVFGSEQFKDDIEHNLNRRVKPEKPGPKAK